MTEQEILQEKLVEKLNSKIEETASKVKEGMVSFEQYHKDIEEIKTGLANAKQDETIKGLQESVEKIAKDFQSFKESRMNKPTIAEDFKSAIKMFEENLKNNKPYERIQVKTVGDMLTSTHVAGTGAQPRILTELAEIRFPIAKAFQQCNVFTMSEGQIVDVSQTGAEGAAAATAEGSAKNQVDFNIYGTVYNTTAVNAYVNVSRQMLKNFGYLENKLNNYLLRQVINKMSSYVYEGSGTPPVWKGINQFAASWAAGSYANAYAIPTLIHTIIIGIGQVRTALYEPNYVNINPADYASIYLAIIEKQINLPQVVVTGQELSISGVRVVPNSHITSDKIQIGDFSMSNIALQGPYEMFVDPYTGLTSNKITILGEQHGIHFVEAAHTNAFVLADISTANAALLAS